MDHIFIILIMAAFTAIAFYNAAKKNKLKERELEKEMLEHTDRLGYSGGRRGK